MSDIQKGAPPLTSQTRHSPFNEMIVEMLDLAIADRGQWYSIPLPDDKPVGGYASTAAGIIGRRLADVSTREGRLWIRMKP